MSANDSSLIVPSHGTVFFAPDSATLPAKPLEAFALGKAAPEGWVDLGHTSRENTIAFSKDGGDKEQLDTWYADAVRVVYASSRWSLTVGALQMEKQTLDMAFGGSIDPSSGAYVVPATAAPMSGQIAVLFQDNTANMLFYMPNTQTTLEEAPSVNVEGFFEIQLGISLLSSDKLNTGGKQGIMAIYKDTIKPVAESSTGR